jgi:hypothetical protein
VVSLLLRLPGVFAAQVIDTGSVLLESACSVDRVHEALAATLPLVPGCQYYRSAHALPQLQHTITIGVYHVASEQADWRMLQPVHCPVHVVFANAATAQQLLFHQS